MRDMWLLTSEDIRMITLIDPDNYWITNLLYTICENLGIRGIDTCPKGQKHFWTADCGTGPVYFCHYCGVERSRVE